MGQHGHGPKKHDPSTARARHSAVLLSAVPDSASAVPGRHGPFGHV
jgi:hypothetical protein